MADDNLTVYENKDYQELLDQIGEELHAGRSALVSATKSIMLGTYWNIGRDIVEYEQKGNAKAEYGSDVLNRLSRDLTERHGKGFSRSYVVYMRKLYLTYPKSQTLSDFLSFSHYTSSFVFNTFSSPVKTFSYLSAISRYLSVEIKRLSSRNSFIK